MQSETRHQTDMRLREEAAATARRQRARIRREQQLEQLLQESETNAETGRRFLAACVAVGDTVKEAQRHGRGPKPGSIFISRHRALTDAERAERDARQRRQSGARTAAKNTGTAYFNRNTANDGARPGYSQEMRTFNWSPR